MGDSGQISYLSGLQCTPLILKNGNKNTYLAALWGVSKKITCVVYLIQCHTPSGDSTMAALVTHHNFLYNRSTFDKKATCWQYIQARRTFRVASSFSEKIIRLLNLFLKIDTCKFWKPEIKRNVQHCTSVPISVYPCLRYSSEFLCSESRDPPPSSSLPQS